MLNINNYAKHSNINKWMNDFKLRFSKKGHKYTTIFEKMTNGKPKKGKTIKHIVMWYGNWCADIICDIHIYNNSKYIAVFDEKIGAFVIKEV